LYIVQCTIIESYDRINQLKEAVGAQSQVQDQPESNKDEEMRDRREAQSRANMALVGENNENDKIKSEAQLSSEQPSQDKKVSLL